MRIGSRYAQNAREAFGRQPQYHTRIHFERIRDGVFHRRSFRIGVVVFLNRATHRLDELPDQTHQIILLKHVRNPVLSNGVPARRCAGIWRTISLPFVARIALLRFASLSNEPASPDSHSLTFGVCPKLATSLLGLAYASVPAIFRPRWSNALAVAWRPFGVRIMSPC